MNLTQRMYERAPVTIQNGMVSVRGILNARKRYGRQYWTHRNWLMDYDQWGLEQKQEHQSARLAEFVTTTVERSPFYEEFYSDVDHRGVLHAEDLNMLPILEKEQLRSRMQDVYTVCRRRSVEGHTGGTTGKSLVVRFTIQDMMERMAVLDHFKSRQGFEHREMRRATFSGKHIIPRGMKGGPLWRFNSSCRQMLYSTFDMAEQNMGAYVKSLNEFQPHAIDGFFSSIIEIAKYIDKNQVPLSFRPKAIFPTAETVHENGRDLVERVFAAPIFDQYASSEGAPFVTECSHGRLHVQMSTGIIEQLDGTDEVLVTSFTTHGTPLIRYRIGDSMKLSAASKCSCGEESPTVDTILGRKDDYLISSNGARINAGNVANMFKNMPNSVINAQVIQKQIGAVRVLLEVDETLYKESFDKSIMDEFHQKLGVATRVTIQKVATIPREKSGKQRLIKNVVGE